MKPISRARCTEFVFPSIEPIRGSIRALRHPWLRLSQTQHSVLEASVLFARLLYTIKRKMHSLDYAESANQPKLDCLLTAITKAGRLCQLQCSKASTAKDGGREPTGRYSRRLYITAADTGGTPILQHQRNKPLDRAHCTECVACLKRQCYLPATLTNWTGGSAKLT